MRLINTETLKLEQFLETPQPYATLSHTWGADEVTFEDFMNTSLRERKAGYKKVALTCAQARKEGLKYAWVDTCCIDKSNHSELVEAITSMFRWYQKSAICYAYLTDVPEDDNLKAKGSKFSKSRWFTRGWTLQELIAPTKVVFYGAKWGHLGDKISLGAQLFEITKIQPGILRGGKLSDISVAERMSWASRRQTTREEDLAYCLMGVFDVNMPMMYGEGPKAFVRLQEYIMQDSDDHSLFAWRASAQSAKQSPYRGLLADSPAEFAGCAGIQPFRNIVIGHAIQNITNRGFPLTTNYEVLEQTPLHKIRAGLNCRWGNDFNSVVGIDLVGQGGDRFMRSSPDQLFKCPSYYETNGTSFVVKSGHASNLNLHPGPLNLMYGFYFAQLPQGMAVGAVFPRDAKFAAKERILELGPWKSDKAVVQLVWNNPTGAQADACLLLFLWVEPVQTERRTTYRHFFEVAVCRKSRTAEAIMKARKPSRRAEERVASFESVIPGIPPVAVNIKPNRVQGFDMFVVEARNGPGSTVVSLRPQSSASAGGGRQGKQVAGRGKMQGMLGRMGRAMSWNRVKC